MYSKHQRIPDLQLENREKGMRNPHSALGKKENGQRRLPKSVSYKGLSVMKSDPKRIISD